MAHRNVYGLDNSENGWEMVDQGSCVWVAVPGTTVHLQIREGQPAAILGAFVADWNAFIEPVRDADSACWTATNDVPSSNHLSGTACDVDWDSHPFRVADAGFNQAQLATMNEMLDYYEDMVFWGNNWQSPKDPMHVQMNGDTYGSANVKRVNDFIAKKIRADGFSTFRRSVDTPPVVFPPIPPPATLTRAEGYALRILNEGRKRQVTPKGIQIAFATGIVESNITVYANEKLPKSLALPHDAVGNDSYSVGIFQQQVRDTGNGWWWGDEATCMGVESSAGLFYDRLVKLPYNGTSKSPGAFAQQIQGSAFPDRYDQHWDEAVALYNKLAGITPPPTTPPTQGDEELSAEAERQIGVIYNELTKKFTSRSPLRHVGEGPLDTVAGFVLNVDGNEHVALVTKLASYGDPDALALLNEVASNTDPNRQHDAKLAQAILADTTATPPPVSVLTPVTAAPIQPMQTYYPPDTVPARLSVSIPPSSTGQVIGQAYDALEALQASGALNNSESAPLVAALINVLQTKTFQTPTNTEGVTP